MSAPTAPAFLLDGNDVAVIADPSDATRELEPFLTEQPVEFYDARARLLRIVVEGRKVRLEVTSEEVHEERLRRALARFLRAAGHDVPDDTDLLAFTTAAGALIL